MLHQCPRCGYRIPRDHNGWRCPHCQASLLERGEVPGPWLVAALWGAGFLLPTTGYILLVRDQHPIRLWEWVPTSLLPLTAVQEAHGHRASVILILVALVSVGVVLLLERALRRRRRD